MSSSSSPGSGGSPSASDAYRTVERAVRAALTRHRRIREPLPRAVAHGQLLAALAEQVIVVTAERDAALMEVLADPGHKSHRALARELGLSRQRVDQLAVIARQGRPDRSR